MQVLIIDSSLNIADRVKELLLVSKNVKAIYTAASYEEASGILNSKIPEVVVLDTGLPKQKSIKFLMEIKQANARICVIVMSAVANNIEMDKYNQAGADFFLDKYHDFDKIAAAIQQHNNKKNENRF